MSLNQTEEENNLDNFIAEAQVKLSAANIDLQTLKHLEVQTLLHLCKIQEKIFDEKGKEYTFIQNFVSAKNPTVTDFRQKFWIYVSNCTP